MRALLVALWDRALGQLLILPIPSDSRTPATWRLCHMAPLQALRELEGWVLGKMCGALHGGANILERMVDDGQGGLIKYASLMGEQWARGIEGQAAWTGFLHVLLR